MPQNHKNLPTGRQAQKFIKFVFIHLVKFRVFVF